MSTENDEGPGCLPVEQTIANATVAHLSNISDFRPAPDTDLHNASQGKRF